MRALARYYHMLHVTVANMLTLARVADPGRCLSGMMGACVVSSVTIFASDGALVIAQGAIRVAGDLA